MLKYVWMYKLPRSARIFPKSKKKKHRKVSDFTSLSSNYKQIIYSILPKASNNPTSQHTVRATLQKPEAVLTAQALQNARAPPLAIDIYYSRGGESTAKAQGGWKRRSNKTPLSSNSFTIYALSHSVCFPPDMPHTYTHTPIYFTHKSIPWKHESYISIYVMPAMKSPNANPPSTTSTYACNYTACSQRSSTINQHYDPFIKIPFFYNLRSYIKFLLLQT